MATQTLMTAAEFDLLPEEVAERHELFDGELVEMPSPTPRHNEILGYLVHAVVGALRAAKTGKAYPETEFLINDRRRVKPDLALLATATLTRLNSDVIPIPFAPDIAAEIVSPSESAQYLDRKIRGYLASGTAEVWVIYPDGQHMYVHTNDAVRHLRVHEALTCGLLPGWSLPLSDLFAE